MKKLILAATIMASLVLAQQATGAEPMTKNWTFLSAQTVLTNSTDATAGLFTITPVTSTPMPLRPGTGVGILVEQVGTNTSHAGGAVKYIFSAAADKVVTTSTKWSTLPDLNVRFALNSATVVVGYSNFPASTLENMRWLKLTGVANGYSNYGCIVSNVQAFYWQTQ